MATDECEFRDHHPEISTKLDELARRVGNVEDTLRDREDGRVEDLKEFNDKLGAVHEKVNTIATSVADLKGHKAGALAAAGILFTLISVGAQLLLRK
jgi:tetrahydromethanopterin S-methyltransferase subunit G